MTDANDVYWQMEEWDYKKAHPKAEYGKYDAYDKAVETGNNLTAETNRYLNHGVKKETLSSQITEKFKPQYLALLSKGRTSEAANLKNRLLRAYEVLGYNRASKSKDIDAWPKQEQKKQEQKK